MWEKQQQLGFMRKRHVRVSRSSKRETPSLPPKNMGQATMKKKWRVLCASAPRRLTQAMALESVARVVPGESTLKKKNGFHVLRRRGQLILLTSCVQPRSISNPNFQQEKKAYTKNRNHTKGGVDPPRKTSLFAISTTQNIQELRQRKRKTPWGGETWHS